MPAGGSESATASAGLATLAVVASQWEGEPSDLTDYVTPVAVELTNGGGAPLRVCYFDFALTDEKGFRYAALNPYVTAEATSSAEPAATGEQVAQADALPSLDGTLLAWRGGRFSGGVVRPHFGGGAMVRPRGFSPAPRFGTPMGPHFRPSVVPHHGWGVRPGIGVPPRAFVRGGIHIGAPRWRGYSVLPYYRPWFGVGFGYWANPFVWPLGYATWVWAWSPSYYPSESVPEDVIGYGMPEGVLEPGGRTSGFLYFQRSHDDAKNLTLSWNVVDAQSQQPLGDARVLLEVRRP